MSDLFTFVPITEYEAPSMPVRGAAAQAWAAFAQRFTQDKAEQVSPAKPEEELRALSGLQLEHLVAPINWTEVAKSLDSALKGDTPEAAGSAGVVFVIGQPHCGHGEIVEAWAADHRANCLHAPRLEQILEADQAWPGDWPEAGQPWVLPRLEQCFLRHSNGLTLIRRLFEKLVGDDAGDGLIGCDSWAWAYLQHVWPIAGAKVITLQAFDAQRLVWLFSRLAINRPGGRLRFRNLGTGRDTLTVPSEDDKVGEEIVQLAAHCRGNVGTARNYWRVRLRSEREIEAAQGASEGASTDPLDEIVWVSGAKHEPMPLAENDEEVALLLHAVLLHGGLAEQALPEVLPLAKHRCIAILRRLQHLGLLEHRQARWSVAPLAYAMVREWISSRGLLRDDF